VKIRGTMLRNESHLEEMSSKRDDIIGCITVLVPLIVVSILLSKKQCLYWVLRNYHAQKVNSSELWSLREFLAKNFM
jgi:hypothetical protein